MWSTDLMLYLFHGEIANPVCFMRWCEHLDGKYCRKAILVLPM